MANPIKPTYKTEIVPLILLLSAWVLSFYFYQLLPTRVVIHWDSLGRPDGYAGRFFTAFFFPLFNLVIYILMLFIPLLDPRKKNYSYFRSAYHLIKAAIVFFLWLVYLIVIFKNLGHILPVQIVVPLLIGLLFVVIGLNLRQIKPNYFFGIRTPWTLHSATVWQRTHRFGSYAFVIGGLLMCLFVFLSSALSYFIVLVFFIVLLPIIYSYFIYLKH